MRSNRFSTVTLIALLLLLTANTASGQETAQPAHVALQVGLFQFDLEGEGYAPMVAGRASFPLATVLMIEGSVLAARPGQDLIDETTNLVIPEAQFQLTLPFTNVIPYIGLGAGAAIDFRSEAAGGTQSWVTFAGSIGIKSWFFDRGGAQAEYRVRGIGDTGYSSNEFSVGVIWQL